MRMRKISEKVPNLEDLVQKLLLVQGSGAYHLSAPLHCNTAKLPLTLVSGSSFLLGQFTAPQAPAACAAAHGGRLRGHVDGRKRARAQYPPGTNPAPDSLQNHHPPARRSGQPDARSCAAQRRAHAACRPLLSGLSPLPRRKTGPTVLTAEPVIFMQFSGMFDPFREVRRGRCPHRPDGTLEFAGDFRKICTFCRDDVGIVPYANLGNFQTPVGADASVRPLAVRIRRWVSRFGGFFAGGQGRPPLRNICTSPVIFMPRSRACRGGGTCFSYKPPRRAG